jgi:MarR family transcriptional regulator for hemolysin
MSNDPPLGLLLAQTAKAASRAFDAALAAAGGSQPTWLILLAVKSGQAATQREIAAAVGIEGATLTHHLAGLERQGLVSRVREGRIQRVSLTDAGEAVFKRLRTAALAHDKRLRAELDPDDERALRELLLRLAAALR